MFRIYKITDYTCKRGRVWRDARRRGRSPCRASEERKIEADQCPVSASAVNCTEPLQPTSSFFLFFSLIFFSSSFASKLHLPLLGAPVSRIIFPSNFQDHKTRLRLFLSKTQEYERVYIYVYKRILFPLRYP